MKIFRRLFSNSSIHKKLIFFILIIIIETASVCLTTVFLSKIIVKDYDNILKEITILNGIKKKISDVKYLAEDYYMLENYSSKDLLIQLTDEINTDLKILPRYIYSDKGKILYTNVDKISKGYFKSLDILINSMNSSVKSDMYTEVLNVNNYLDRMVNLLIDYELESHSQVYEIVHNLNNNLINIMIVLLFMIFIINIYYAFSFSKDLYQPISKLVNSAKELSQGNFSSPDIEVARNDEIGYLIAIFNKMKNDIFEYIKTSEDRARIEALLKDAELRALQSQVNPHFLFNALSMVIESALLEQADETLGIVEEISYILRYSLTSFKKKVFINNEIEMMKNYISLQHKRYGDRIRIDVIIENDLPNIEVPSMIFQPIIENAVIHGLESKLEGGNINVYLCNMGNYILCRVNDNGVGISHERLIEVFSDDNISHVGHTTGIGINNVKSRLENFYRAAMESQKIDLLTISSEVGVGTSVKILLPIIYPWGESNV
ncbi:histidine kinase [Petroclostridium sp. X23]|uniref:sensor histidine kinase n=1 Tax=Petroclostridium sp. X23 TaxID=3045146 RepID=UPI0024AC8608|nr:histidine kinase [Petroclostridium sp. X23]WHH60889.1 histidine kinase [Petroclostridium sp. X23]